MEGPILFGIQREGSFFFPLWNLDKKPISVPIGFLVQVILMIILLESYV